MVAELAQVSETTVSLAFKSKSRISEKTRNLVREIARQVGYVPNQYARSLRAKSTRLIGLLINDIVNPFYAKMADLVEKHVEASGYQLLVFGSGWEEKREMAAIQRMAELRVEGVLACFSETSDAARRFMDDNNMSYVTLDTSASTPKGAHVLIDLELAGRLAASHFADLGCRRPLLLMPKVSNGCRFSAFENLEKGFIAEWKRRVGSGETVKRMGAELDIAAGREAFSDSRRIYPQVDSVLCGNDLCALGVIDAADHLNIKVGEELAVMGVGDIPVGSIDRLGLSTISEPVEKVAEYATQALIESVTSGTELRIGKYVEPTLVLRASSLRFQRQRE